MADNRRTRLLKLGGLWLAAFAAILVIIFVTYLQLLTSAVQRFSTHAAAGHARAAGRSRQYPQTVRLAIFSFLTSLLESAGAPDHTRRFVIIAFHHPPPKPGSVFQGLALLLIIPIVWGFLLTTARAEPGIRPLCAG